MAKDETCHFNLFTGFSPLTFQARILFISIDRVSPHRFYWEFKDASFLVVDVIDSFLSKAIKRIVGFSHALLLTSSKTLGPSSRLAGNWIRGWFIRYLQLLSGLLFLYDLLFPHDHLKSLFIFLQVSIRFGCFLFVESNFAILVIVTHFFALIA